MEHIVFAGSSDIEEIEIIMKTAWSSSLNKDWYVVADRDFISHHIEHSPYILKYMENAQIAGFLIVRHPELAEDSLGRYLNNWDGELLRKVAHMESAAVVPEFRGRGIQKKLLITAEEFERTRGTEYLMATVHPDNCYSADNMEQLGYKCLLEAEKYSGLKRKIMCKQLI